MSAARRVLFVDDERSMRQTLPAVLERKGFTVVAVDSVAEAISAIGQAKFEILISDLNIGEPGDGFTVVSAMRRVQPDCRSFILTGYPDFDSALRAIRNQVDDYLVKPADPDKLVAVLEGKMGKPRPTAYGPLKQTSQLLRELEPQIAASFVERLNAKPEFRQLGLQAHQLSEPVSLIVAELIRRVRSEADGLTPEGLTAASAYGTLRHQQGYSMAMLVTEGHTLQHVVSKAFQDNLLRIEMSTLIGDMIRIGDALNSFIEEAIRSFSGAALPHIA